MHKLTKGIKKKIKGKKDKHSEDDLFSSAELEKYRKEQEEAAEGKRVAFQDPDAPEPKEESEEWQRFKALTSGIDTVLKKTQEDLDRLKTHSYYQKKKQAQPKEEEDKEKGKCQPTSSKSKKWIGFEEGQGLKEEGVESDKENQPEEAEDSAAGKDHKAKEREASPATSEKLPIVDIPEEDFEEDEGIFDTSYVDVVTSGEIKFAYVPESPTNETQDNEPDPFDTSAVEKVIKSYEPEAAPTKYKKRLVDLGLAAEVLAGKVDKTQVSASSTSAGGKVSKRRRVIPKEVNLLGSFDNGSNQQQGPEKDKPKSPDLETLPESLLDADVRVVLPVSVTVTEAPPSALDLVEEAAAQEEDRITKEEDVGLKNLVAEFDIIQHNEPDTAVSSVIEERFPEAKKFEDDLEDEFAALAAGSISKTSEAADAKPLKEEEKDPFVSDPFDTSVADFALGAVEVNKEPLELPEQQVPVQTSWADFEERDANEVPKKPPPPRPPPVKPSPPVRPPVAKKPTEEVPSSTLLTSRDLLAGSTTDLTRLGEDPIAPVVPKFESKPPEEDFDPFDTSIVDTSAAPGRAELRLLEQELLTPVVDGQDDSDFDPRAGEPPPPPRPKALKVGGFDDDDDALSAGIAKPLTPAAEQVTVQPKEEEKEQDPFDTSHVEALAPGKTELKLLEKELVEEPFVPPVNPPRKLSDFEFNPRQDEPKRGPPPPRPIQLPIKQETVPISNPDFLHSPVGETKPDVKSLTPLVEGTDKDLCYVDPFDTSFVAVLPPGKAELKLIESELVGTTDSASDDDFNPRESDPKPPSSSEVSLTTETIFEVGDQHRVKPLTPLVERKHFEVQDDLDPFDTSIASNLLPGKSELKVLENELLQSTEVTPLKKRLSDPDFNPRDENEDVKRCKPTLSVAPPPPPPAKVPARPQPPKTLPLTDIIGSEEIAVKPLSPAFGTEPEITYADPFDTSIAENIAPGKAELKLLADELVNGEGGGSLKRSVTDPDFNPRTDEEVEEVQLDENLLESRDPHKVKPLTPLVERKPIASVGHPEEEEEVDPFDTSIVDRIAQPGKAEIRVLESQLLN